jgi:hypothetical protein
MIERLRFYAAIWPRASHSSAEIAMLTNGNQERNPCLGHTFGSAFAHMVVFKALALHGGESGERR